MKDSAGDQITIRTAQAKDAPRLAALSGQLGYTTTPDEILRRLPRLGRDHEHVVFVAEDGSGTVIAWTHAFVCHLVEADPQTEVSVLVVAATRPGNGVGRLRNERVEPWARERNGRAERAAASSRFSANRWSRGRRGPWGCAARSGRQLRMKGSEQGRAENHQNGPDTVLPAVHH